VLVGPDVYRSRFPDTYTEDMKALLNDKEFSDIKFCFPEEDGKTIFAHKSILAVRCAGFRTMLRYRTTNDDDDDDDRTESQILII